MIRYRNYGGALVPDRDGQWVHVKDVGIKKWTLDPLIPTTAEATIVERLAWALHEVEMSQWGEGYIALELDDCINREEHLTVARALSVKHDYLRKGETK